MKTNETTTENQTQQSPEVGCCDMLCWFDPYDAEPPEGATILCDFGEDFEEFDPSYKHPTFDEEWHGFTTRYIVGEYSQGKFRFEHTLTRCMAAGDLVEIDVDCYIERYLILHNVKITSERGHAKK